ncbi:MAG: hypothetical protein J0I75_04565 [Hyphomicrobium sp.]|nr:hypothetical protein [Hyphomicrobium sp.]
MSARPSFLTCSGPSRHTGWRHRATVAAVIAGLLLPFVPQAPLRAQPGQNAAQTSEPPPAGQSAPASVPQSVPMSRAEYEQCQVGDEATFRAAVARVTQAALTKSLADLDYAPIVRDAWRRNNVDDVLWRQVDVAIGEVREESSWTELIGSIAFQETAQKLATTTSERVFRSDAMQKAILGVASGVGNEVGRRMEQGLSAAAEPVAQCMQAFLGPRYGSMVARSVSRDTGREFTIDPSKASATVSTGQVLIQGSEGLTGTVLLIVRRQLSRMAMTVGQRVVGAILSRIVGVVAGGVGIALIAKDIWEFRHGVLPIIATEMKSADTRDKIQAELAKVIGEQINEHTREISSTAAERVTEIWREFRRAHANVLELAEKHERFRRFLDTVTPAKLPRLDEVVALILAGEGEPALTRRLNDGTLHRAIETMPAEAITIARDTKSLEAGFKWWALADERLPEVVAFDLHRLGSPEEMSKAALGRLLVLEDRTAITRLASLTRAEREPLLELPPRDLNRLARALPETDLKALSRYMSALEPAAAQRLLAVVGFSPARMAAYTASGVQAAILASRDQTEAVAVIARSDAIFDFFVFADDVRSVREGKISPLLLWARYPVALSVFAFAALIVLLILWRLLFGRRPRIVIAQNKS